MAVYSFKIPQNGISSGVPGASGENITVDRGMSRQSTHRVLTSKFGDGYEQRVLDGINTKNEQFSITLNNRTREEINKVARFLDNYAGKAFEFTITNHTADEVIKVVADSYNLVYIHTEIHSLQTTFRRVYEP